MLRFFVGIKILLLLFACLPEASAQLKPSVYYNLQGQKFTLPGVGASRGKMIVFTRSSSKAIIRQAIRENAVLSLPSREVLDTMNAAYLGMGSSGNMLEFFVGLKGKVSLVIQGDRDSIGPDQLRQARVDLSEVKNDNPAYDVHTHGDSVSLSGNPYFFGYPSADDLNPRHFRNRRQMNIILSYEKETSHEISIANQTVRDVERASSIYRTIVFYNPNPFSFELPMPPGYEPMLNFLNSTIGPDIDVKKSDP